MYGMAACLDDGLVADLGVGVSMVPQHVHRCHHRRHIHARSEGVEGDVLLHALRPHVGADLCSPTILEQGSVPWAGTSKAGAVHVHAAPLASELLEGALRSGTMATLLELCTVHQ